MPSPIAPISPLVLKDVELILGAADAVAVADTDNDFRKHVDTVTLTPTSSTVNWTGLGANTHSDVSTATWTATLAGAQDWSSDVSLCRFLFDNEGDTRPYLLRPRAGSGPSFTGKVIITPGAIGGQVNAVAPFNVTLGLTAKPTLVPAV
ncbi:hypothetical protein [Actinotalea sp.]|uniref:hypothetical protein n=1 Tax=Actinotalea sp. TaxID=1872145 RepID=UPI0035660938